MSRWIPLASRQLVAKRAEHQCEYCRFPAHSAWLSFEIEHIIAQKHGGSSESENLALACPECNRFKGTDIGSLDPHSGQLVPFFNPRQQAWAEHFKLTQGEVVPLSPEGRATVNILRINLPERILERQRLVDAGVYPISDS